MTEKDSSLYMCGDARYCPPLIWAMRATRLLVGLVIDLHGLTEHELYEDFIIADGCARQVYFGRDDIQTGEMLWDQTEGLRKYTDRPSLTEEEFQRMASDTRKAHTRDMRDVQKAEAIVKSVEGEQQTAELKD